MTLSKPIFLFLLALLFVFTNSTQAQNKSIEQIKLVLEVGSARELSQYLNNKVDLNINGIAATYSHTQAEGVLKNFFKENPPQSFQFNHEGASENGLIYAIGEYKSNDASFRVWIRLKKINDQFLIHEMSFAKE